MRASERGNVLSLPQVSYSSTDSALSDKNQYVYFSRTIEADDQQCDRVVSLMGILKLTTIAIISSDESHALSYADMIAVRCVRR